MRSFNARCAFDIGPDAKRIKEHLDHSQMVVDRAQSAYRLREGRADSLLAYREDLNLNDAAFKLGFLTAEQFDKWVRPADMTHPLASWSLRAAKSLSSFKRKQRDCAPPDQRLLRAPPANAARQAGLR